MEKQTLCGLIVSTLNEDGKTLTPKWKYGYRSTTNKDGDREESISMEFATTDERTPAYLLTITSNDSICIMELCRMEQTFVTLSVTANKVFIM